MQKASHAGSEEKEKGEAVAQQRKENVDKDEDGKGKYGRWVGVWGLDRPSQRQVKNTFAMQDQLCS